MTGCITVVTGLPRSGTSLVMQMLQAGGMPVLIDGVRAADADNPRGYFEYEPVKHARTDDSWVELACGKAVKVIHALIPALPDTYDYRVIRVRRPMREVLASQRAMLARAGKKGAGIPDERLAAAYEAQLSQADRFMAARRNFRCLDISHRDCIVRPAAVADAIAEFLETTLDRGRMAAVVDPALYRNRG